MAETPVPITTGSGAASIAADVVSNNSYQQIKLVDGTLGNNTALIVNSDGTANVRISGSVATAGGTFTGSVSGTIGASIIGQLPGGTAVLGSVATLQGTNPWVIVGSVYGSGSVVAFQGGTQTTSIVGGASVFQAGPWTTSIVGGASVFQAGTWSTSIMTNVITSIATAGQVMGSVAALQATNPWNVAGSVAAFVVGNSSIITVGQGSIAVNIISGSIAASFTPPANQSVSGTVQTDIRGSVAVAIISGSIAATFTPPANQSVSGTVGVTGSVATLQGTNPWIVTGSVQGVMSVLGTVPVTQSTNPWIITGSVQGSFSPSGNQSVSGTVQVDVRGSVAVAIISGSIAATFTPPANQSVSGTAGASIIGQLPGGTAVLGSVAALQGTNPWIVTSSIAGGLFPITGSVAATIVGTPNVNAAGSVVAFQGTSPWVVNFQNSSVIAINAGSVVAISQGSVITLNQGSSILAVPVGSVITVFQAPSIVGTYAEDAASASGDKGFLVMGARNDTLSSITSADGDYSSHVVGPSGELIAANAPFTKWISGTTSIMYGASVAVIAAQGSSVFIYITGIQVANMAATTVLITLQGASSSTLGFTLGPSSGGSNIYFQNGIKTNANGAFTASISGVASVYISAQGFIAKI